MTENELFHLSLNFCQHDPRFPQGFLLNADLYDCESPKKYFPVSLESVDAILWLSLPPVFLTAGSCSL